MKIFSASEFVKSKILAELGSIFTFFRYNKIGETKLVKCNKIIRGKDECDGALLAMSQEDVAQ